MIKINKYEYQVISAFDPYGNYIGDICNEVELADLQYQIAKEKVEGYFFVFEDNIYHINNKGEIINHPENLYREVINFIQKRFEIFYANT